ALGPSSAPKRIAIAMITTSTGDAMAPSLNTVYGKNGLPCPLKTWYSRRYCSCARAFTRSLPAPRLDLFLRELARLLRLHPRRRGHAQLHDEVEMGADERRHQARNEQHVDRVEAADRGRPELRAAAQEVGEVRPDD